MPRNIRNRFFELIKNRNQVFFKNSDKRRFLQFGVLLIFAKQR